MGTAIIQLRKTASTEVHGPTHNNELLGQSPLCALIKIGSSLSNDELGARPDYRPLLLNKWGESNNISPGTES